MQYTAVPKARLTFQANNVVIAAKIATNTTSIVATCTLPVNFAYTFEYAACSAQVVDDIGDADHFGDVAAINFSFGDGLGTRRGQLFSRGLTETGLNAGSVKTWEPLNTYTPPIYNQNGASPIISLAVNDNDAVNATNAGLFSCVVSFLQFDFAQVFAYPLNFPLPVSNR